MSGILYVVATPIGNLEDLSARALKILNTVGCIAAEDTRHTKQLLNHFGISKPLLALHEHNEYQRSDILISRLKNGEKIALVSDAGTPLISDPGQHLIARIHEENLSIVPIPGPCALITALSVLGFPASQFLFLGFLPSTRTERKKILKLAENNEWPIVFYEAPHRIQNCLMDLMETIEASREIGMARELTKKHESLYRGNLKTIVEKYSEECARGELVVVIGENKTDKHAPDLTEGLRVFKILNQTLSHKDAVALAAEITGARKKELYQQTLNENKK